MGTQKFLGREPVLWLGLFRAAIVLAVAFGLTLTQEQLAAVYLFIEGSLSLYARSQVSPVGE